MAYACSSAGVVGAESLLSAYDKYLENYGRFVSVVGGGDQYGVLRPCQGLAEFLGVGGDGEGRSFVWQGALSAGLVGAGGDEEPVVCAVGGEKVGSSGSGAGVSAVDSGATLCGSGRCETVVSAAGVQGSEFTSVESKRERNRRWRLEKKLKKERRKSRRGVEAVASSAGSWSSPELRRSLDARRVVENELARERAEAQLELFRDKGVKKMRTELEKRKLEGQVCSALLRSQKSLDDVASVRPESSISQHEAEAMKQQLDDAMFRLSVMEELAREKASREEFNEASKLAPVPTFVVPPLEMEVTMADRVRAVKEAFPELHPEHVARRSVGVDF